MLSKNYIFHPDKEINKLLQNLSSLHPIKIDLSLDRIKKLLKKLDNPHRNIPKVIHVAGTNGKGSTATIIYELLKNLGQKVHVYRSPHLVLFNERIHVSNKEISNKYLKKILQRIMKKNNGDSITFFEITTAAAFLSFAENSADICVIEVGLGGKYDATNIIKNTFASIITPIGKDHTEFLGNSLTKITKEKAGIIKDNCLLICSKQNYNVKKIIRETGVKKNCNKYIHGDEWVIKNKSLYFDDTKTDLSMMSLNGEHQLYNAGCAIIACKKIKGLGFDSKKVLAALQNIEWKGRLQKLKGKLAEKYPKLNIWVDAAHNKLGFYVLKKWINKERLAGLQLIVSIGVKKDYESILNEAKEMRPSVIYFPKRVKFASHDAYKLLSKAKELKINSYVIEDVFEAVAMCSRLKNRKLNNNIVITGSINLIGQILYEDRKFN